MKINRSYDVKLTGHNWRVLMPTLLIFRQMVKLLLDVCLDNYDSCIAGLSAKEAQRNIDLLIHGGNKDGSYHKPVYHFFEKRFYKTPNVIRRAAVDSAVAAVRSYMELYALWEAEGDTSKKPPKLNYNQAACPCLFKRDAFIDNGDGTCRIKIYRDNDWVWYEFRMSASDLRYIQKRCADFKLSAPVLEKRMHHFHIRFSVSYFQKLPVYSQYPENDEVLCDCICAVDLGVNTDAVCSIMHPDGTVTARRFINLPVEKDRMYRVLGQMKKSQSINGNYKHKKLWRIVNNYNEAISVHTASEIVKFAVQHGAKVIVMEHLDTNGKIKGGKKQRLALWCKKDILARVTALAHYNSLRISTVCAKNTSKLAFDGSGMVSRGVDGNYSICSFTGGKIYNCDLSASYNIGARYFIRELTKSLSETEERYLKAKVPEISKRTLCTLSTLTGLNAALCDLRAAFC